MLDKTAILAALDLKRETVPCPEWGGDVLLQEMSALDRDRLHSETNQGEKLDTVNYMAKVLVRCIISEDGSRIFCDEEAEALGRKSAPVLHALFERANILNGNNALPEEQEKNSEPGPTDSSPSDSV